MNLGFKDQFVPYVLDGSKTHTIRAGERWKPGMRADLYAEPRRRKVYGPVCPLTRRRWVQCGCGQCERGVSSPVDGQISGMRLLFRAEVVRVERICIWLRKPQARLYADEPVFAGALGIAIADEILSDDEANALAWRDGFRAMPLVQSGPLNALAEMAQFWLKNHADFKPFHGQIIHWDYEQRFMEKRGNAKQPTNTGRAVRQLGRALPTWGSQ